MQRRIRRSRPLTQAEKERLHEANQQWHATHSTQQAARHHLATIAYEIYLANGEVKEMAETLRVARPTVYGLIDQAGEEARP